MKVKSNIGGVKKTQTIEEKRVDSIMSQISMESLCMALRPENLKRK